MANEPLPDDAPATELFPQYERGLHRMLADEVEGLTDEQLDWRSDRWEWSKWSIRRQVSHMATFVRRFLLHRWADQLFPHGTSHLGALAADFSPSPSGSWLEESRFWELPVLLEQIDISMRLAHHVLSGETAGSMRRKELSLEVPGPAVMEFWRLGTTAHPTGLRQDPSNPASICLTLEATFRHLYYEFITHMYNIQRLKRAQGLATTVEIPSEGYWVLPQWDRSEP